MGTEHDESGYLAMPIVDGVEGKGKGSVKYKHSKPLSQVAKAKEWGGSSWR